MVNEPDIRRGRHAVWDCHAHLVFVTKYRRGVFTNQMLEACEVTMHKVCEDFGVALVEFNGEDDHVHLLIKFPATIQLSKLVNSLKGVSSRVLRRDYAEHVSPFLWGGHLWSRSYYCGTAGGAPLSVIADYIQKQRRPSSTLLTSTLKGGARRS
ncbi:IS200/IS605 family transposase [Auritidibacter ignavus]|uniref:IS200/IS605 family transposase n=1 Tax=Auritidibacter ignavus TaxID=678932 RepID=UPI00109C811B|nr:IS200/IS605 family transposase [Auritidibacter ignavus]